MYYLGINNFEGISQGRTACEPSLYKEVIVLMTEVSLEVAGFTDVRLDKEDTRNLVASSF
jgi:hypothetical protein